MLMIFLPLIFFLSLLFTRLVHPLSAGMVLLIQTTLISLASGLMSPSFWFSYILFLIFLGGMLVLFIYVASLASNETFKVSLFYLIMILTLTMFSSFALSMVDPILSMNPMSSQHGLINFSSQTNLLPSLTYLIYNSPISTLTIFIILYLLLTLIVVVNITSIYFGPLRFSK